MRLKRSSRRQYWPRSLHLQSHWSKTDAGRIGDTANFLDDTVSVINLTTPFAADDTASTLTNTPVDIDVLANI